MKPSIYHSSILAAIFSSFLAVYINWPPPPLSPALAKWQKNGFYFYYKHTHKIFYRADNGSATNTDVLLCIHGFPTASYDWIKIWDGLKSQFSVVIAVDLLGYGFSDKPIYDFFIKTQPAEILQIIHNYSTFEQADIIEGLMDSLNITSVHIISHDYGDTVAQELIHRFNQRKLASQPIPLSIQSVCFTNGGIFPELNHPKLLQKMIAIPWLNFFLSRLMNYWTFASGLSDVFGKHSKPSHEDLLDWWSLLRWENGHLLAGTLSSYMSERQKYKDRWVEAIQTTFVPLHMIYGSLDPVNPPPFDTEYRKLLPKATITVLPKTGHFVQWENPEETLKSCLEFYNSNR